MDREAERTHARLVLDAFGLGDSVVTATFSESEEGWQVAVRLPGHLDFDFALRADGV